eukprot:NODE_197_length_2507_cov_10.497559_g150_i0.p1 GENE.NODE_197_length_2507_cov_10.497559_g150_i0~~NODE_197_length_2507_cov_10.497559_g150_i0.p1  ORF type:complete len:817 (-),score=248.95 NODE_197_length_2507_cov_10.497559_g150_i0:56-2203(-)
MSLMNLTNCLSALADRRRPTWRSSTLTQMLAESMSNGRVIMIAAVSPCISNFAETLGTCDRANMVKKISISSRANQKDTDPQSQTLKEVAETKKRLEAEIAALKTRRDPESRAALQAAVEEQQEALKEIDESFERRKRELQASLEEKEAAASEQTMAIEDILKTMTPKLDFSSPALTNIAEDPRFSGKLTFRLWKEAPDINWIGKEPGHCTQDLVESQTHHDNDIHGDYTMPPDVALNGFGMRVKHCGIQIDLAAQEAYIIPNFDHQTGDPYRVLVNGRQATWDGKKGTPIKHNDRIWLGHNYLFRFVFMDKDGQRVGPAPDTKDEDLTFDFAETEVQRVQGDLGRDLGLASNVRRRLTQAIRQVEGANLMCHDLGLDAQLECRLYMVTGDDGMRHHEIFVNIKYPKIRTISTMTFDEFEEKSAGLELIYDQWRSIGDRNREIFQLPEDKRPPYEVFTPPPMEQTPFFDSFHTILGEATVFLRPVLHRFSYETQAMIVAPNGACVGHLSVFFGPIDEAGGEGPWVSNQQLFELDPFCDNPIEDTELDTKIPVRFQILSVDYEDLYQAPSRAVLKKNEHDHKGREHDRVRYSSTYCAYRWPGESEYTQTEEVRKNQAHVPFPGHGKIHELSFSSKTELQNFYAGRLQSDLGYLKVRIFGSLDHTIANILAASSSAKERTVKEEISQLQEEIDKAYEEAADLDAEILELQQELDSLR